MEFPRFYVSMLSMLRMIEVEALDMWAGLQGFLDNPGNEVLRGISLEVAPRLAKTIEQLLLSRHDVHRLDNNLAYLHKSFRVVSAKAVATGR